MLKWPVKARRAVASFFVKWNDVDIFVEDTAKYANTVYAQFIGRILDGRAQVSSIFPLGDRTSVIRACAADTAVGGRNRVYLIDGDLDLIADIAPTKLPRLYTHVVYHLENYFICEDALVGVLHEENPRFSEGEIKANLDFPGWMSEIQPLLYLFRVFGVSRILDASLPTVKIGIGTFATQNRIDIEKIRLFCIERMTALERNFPLEEIESAKLKIDRVVEKKIRQRDLVSARDYLLPCLRWWVASKKLQLPAGKESLLFRLSKRSSLDPYPELVAAICETARG